MRKGPAPSFFLNPNVSLLICTGEKLHLLWASEGVLSYHGCTQQVSWATGLIAVLLPDTAMSLCVLWENCGPSDGHLLWSTYLAIRLGFVTSWVCGPCLPE